MLPFQQTNAKPSKTNFKLTGCNHEKKPCSSSRGITHTLGCPQKHRYLYSRTDVKFEITR